MQIDIEKTDSEAENGVNQVGSDAKTDSDPSAQKKEGDTHPKSSDGGTEFDDVRDRDSEHADNAHATATTSYQETYGAPAAPGDPGSGGSDGRYGDIERMALIGLVITVVSLFIGGVLFSAAGAVLEILAMRKLGAVAAASGLDGHGRLVQRRIRLWLIAALAAVALNLISAIILMPIMLEMMRSGDIGSILTTGTAANGSTSIWDS